MLKRTLHLMIGLLVVLATTATTADARDARIAVDADHISFAHQTVGGFRRAEVHVTNKTARRLDTHVAIYQKRGDYTVARLDGKPVDTPLEPGQLVGYEVVFRPTAAGIYTGKLAFYPGDLRDYRNGTERATVITMSGTGYEDVQPLLDAGGYALPADLEVSITGTFAGKKPVFDGAPLVDDPAAVRQIQAGPRFAIRVVNHGPNRTQPVLLLQPRDRRLIDHRELPPGLQGPRLRASLRGDYAGYLPQLAPGQHVDVMVPLRRGVPPRSRLLTVSVSGPYDSDTRNSRGYAQILGGRQPATAPDPVTPPPASDIDVDADRDKGPVSWPVEPVHGSRDLFNVDPFSTEKIRVHVRNWGPGDQKAVRLKVHFNDTASLDPSGTGLPAGCDIERSKTGPGATIECKFQLASGDARDFVFKFHTTNRKLKLGDKSASIDITAEGADPKADPKPLNNHVNIRTSSTPKK